MCKHRQRKTWSTYKHTYKHTLLNYACSVFGTDQLVFKSFSLLLILLDQKYERDLLTRDIETFYSDILELFWLLLKCFTMAIKARSGCYCRINYFCLGLILTPNPTLSTSVFESLIAFKYIMKCTFLFTHEKCISSTKSRGG